MFENEENSKSILQHVIKHCKTQSLLLYLHTITISRSLETFHSAFFLFHFTTFDVTICSSLFSFHLPSPSSYFLFFLFNIVEYNPVMCAQYWSFLSLIPQFTCSSECDCTLFIFRIIYYITLIWFETMFITNRNIFERQK